MNRLTKTFAELKEKSESAFIPFITMGYPTIDETPDLIRSLVQGGADIIEIGIPFSDPMADGPTIQESSQIALKGGITLKKSLEMIKELRAEGIDTPMVLMGYCNPFLAFGMDNLIAAMHSHDISGLIVPDLPPEEAEEWRNRLLMEDLALIPFVSPNSSDERIMQAAKLATGFLYCIAVTGVTGARSSMEVDLPGFLDKVRGMCKEPICVGFGISKVEQVQELAPRVDGVIMASNLIKLIKDKPPGERPSILKAAVQEFKSATKIKK